MLKRRDIGLIVASGAAVAAAGESRAQAISFVGAFNVHGTGVTTVAREPFGADGAPRSPMWQTRSSGGGIFTFERNGHGSAIGGFVTQVGIVYDEALKSDLGWLTPEEVKFEAHFRYTVEKNGAVKIFFPLRSSNRQVVKGRRKGLVEIVDFAGSDKTPSLEGFFSADGQRVSLGNPSTIYTRQSATGRADIYTAKLWDLAGDRIGPT